MTWRLHLHVYVDVHAWICLQSRLQQLLQVRQDQGCPPEIQIHTQVSTRPYTHGQWSDATTYLLAL